MPMGRHGSGSTRKNGAMAKRKRLIVEPYFVGPDRVSRTGRTVYVYGNVERATDTKGREHVTPKPGARPLTSTYGLKRAARKAVYDANDWVILAVLLKGYKGGNGHRWLSIKTTRADIDEARRIAPNSFREQVAEIFQFSGHEPPGEVVAWQATAPQG